MELRTVAFFTLTTIAVASSAASTVNTPRSLKDPDEPGNFTNCPPAGGADACNLEVPCARVRINFGSPQGGHYIWYNFDITNIPIGVEVGTEQSCTNYLPASTVKGPTADEASASNTPSSISSSVANITSTLRNISSASPTSAAIVATVPSESTSPVNMTTTPSTPSPSPSLSPFGDESNSGASGTRSKAIIGGVACGIAVLLIVGLLITLLRRRSPRPFYSMISSLRLKLERHQTNSPSLQPIPFTVPRKSTRALESHPLTEILPSPGVRMKERKERMLQSHLDTDADTDTDTLRTYGYRHQTSAETGWEHPNERIQGPEILARLDLVTRRLAHIEGRLHDSNPPAYSSSWW
ncbi:hypothetical protein V5O48_012921 [Marasmius crinis-equi]|uniref:Mid2 domain-containing protein n=1 Tax=Marasmius crinis-equi TaxID=585013 RepID=A0ABR3F1I0_9AGAR